MPGPDPRQVIWKTRPTRGVVLFVTDQRVELPLQAELYDRDARMVEQHVAFEDTLMSQSWTHSLTAAQ